MAKKKTQDENINEAVEEIQENECQKEENELKEALENKEKELSDATDKYMRIAAEYENYKRRTQKEKEQIYKDSAIDIISQLLPVVDNLERALTAFSDKENEYYKGVDMVMRQTNEVFEKMGVQPIPAVGEEFNPEYHNAVMHIDDETVADNTIVEEFQKGYIYKDKVIRYSMVKVAN